MDRMKPRLATVWLGGCSGCHMSFLDLDERLIDLVGLVDIVYSPIVDRKEFPEADITLVEGAVANEEHLDQIRVIREKSRVLISFGDCAVTGNVTAMRNVVSVEDVLNRAYRETSAVVVGIPAGNSVVPRLLPRVRPVHEVVNVDRFLPGCPPSADEIWQCVMDAIANNPPAEQARRFG
jgi:NAD-reducing hydrogenase small subunit